MNCKHDWHWLWTWAEECTECHTRRCRVWSERLGRDRYYYHYPKHLEKGRSNG